MNPGLMNKLIELYAPTPTVDSMGAPTDTMAPAGTVWANVVNASAAESNVDPRRVASEVATFTVHENTWTKTISPTWEIGYDNRRWNITTVRSTDVVRDMGRYIEIGAKARMEDV